MDNELDLLLGTVIDSLAKIVILLHLQQDPAGAHTPEAVATAVGRQPEPVARALAELAEGGLVTRFPVGRGRITLYAASEDAHVRSLIALLGRHWEQGGESRSEVMRKALRPRPAQDEPPPPRVY